MNRFAASRLLLSYVALICGLFVTHRPREDNLWWTLYATQRSLLWAPGKGEEYVLKYRKNGKGDPKEIRLRATGEYVPLKDTRAFQGKDFDNFKCVAFEFEIMSTTAGEVGPFWILFADLAAARHDWNDGMVFPELHAKDGAYDYAETSSKPTISSFDEDLHQGKIESLKRVDPSKTSTGAHDPSSPATAASPAAPVLEMAPVTATTDIASAGTAISSNVKVRQSAGGELGTEFDVAVKNQRA